MNQVKDAYGTPLRAAIVGGHHEVVTALISQGADANLRARDMAEIDCQDPQLAAAYDRMIEDIMERKRARISPLQLAIQFSHQSVTERLLIAGAEIDDSGLYLHIAVEANKVVATEPILSAGSDVNMGCPGRWPALITACHNGHARMLDLLLARGADANIDGTNEKFGHSALRATCGQGHVWLVSWALTLRSRRIHR